MFLLIPTTLHVQPGIQGIKLKVGHQRKRIEDRDIACHPCSSYFEGVAGLCTVDPQ
jgi:hypothetical protein